MGDTLALVCFLGRQVYVAMVRGTGEGGEPGAREPRPAPAVGASPRRLERRRTWWGRRIPTVATSRSS